MTETFRLDLPLLLPEIPDESDACIGRLTEMLGARPGIGTAHVVAAAGGAPAQLCVHYDPDILSLARIREIVRAAGAAISDRYGHILWEVAGIGHARRARTIAESLRALTGVIGSLMALEAIKLITGAGTPLLGRLHIQDTLAADARVVRVARDPACPVCGETGRAELVARRD